MAIKSVILAVRMIPAKPPCPAKPAVPAKPSKPARPAKPAVPAHPAGQPPHKPTAPKPKATQATSSLSRLSSLARLETKVLAADLSYHIRRLANSYFGTDTKFSPESGVGVMQGQKKLIIRTPGTTKLGAINEFSNEANKFSEVEGVHFVGKHKGLEVIFK
jgi:hypothetical protein